MYNALTTTQETALAQKGARQSEQELQSQRSLVHGCILTMIIIPSREGRDAADEPLHKLESGSVRLRITLAEYPCSAQQNECNRRQSHLHLVPGEEESRRQRRRTADLQAPNLDRVQQASSDRVNVHPVLFKRMQGGGEYVEARYVERDG